MDSHSHLLEDTQYWLVDILQQQDSLELDMEGTHRQLEVDTQAEPRTQMAEVGTLAEEGTQPGGTGGC